MKPFLWCLAILFGAQIAFAERIVVTKDPNRQVALDQGKVQSRTYGGESTPKPSPTRLGEQDEREAYQKLREAAAKACQYQLADYADLTDVHYKKEGIADRIHETEEYSHYIRAEGKVSCVDLKGKQLPVPSPSKFVVGNLQSALSSQLNDQKEIPAVPPPYTQRARPAAAK